MILAVIFGVLYAMTGLPLPYAAEKSLTYLGAISTPMALLMIGARMVDNSVKGEGKAIRLALLFKLILGPVVMTLLAIFLGMPTEEIVTVFVLFAVPTAMNVFIMTKSMAATMACGQCHTGLSTVFRYCYDDWYLSDADNGDCINLERKVCTNE